MKSTLQYNWKYRKYHTRKEVSDNFDKIVPEKVRIKLNSLLWYPYTDNRTPFQEISLMPYQGTPELTAFMRDLNTDGTHRPSFLWREFKQAIFEGWMENKIHVIGASSGYDSRMIAKAIKELMIEHGRDWLGETYFVECAGEAEGFKQIMRTLGWENYIIWIPDYDLDFFKDHHKRYNGLCAYPSNLWYDFYIKNWNEEDIQYISGYGGNVADAMNPNSTYMGVQKLKHTVNGRLIMYFRKNYYYQISAFREPKYSFHPFWSWRYIRATAGVTHKANRTSVLLSNHFVKECKRVKRMAILGEVTQNGHRTVKDKVIKQLDEWYRSTDYGKSHPINPSPNIEYNKWWLQFCIADYVKANNISFR